MSQTLILVEGVADQKFIQDLVLEWYQVELTLGTVGKPGNILALGGKNAFDSPEIAKKLLPILAQQAVDEIPTIVIFDADTFVDNHSYLSLHSQTHGFKFFLLPDHANNGDLETLLQQIICPDNQIIFNCWESYEQCLRGQKTNSTETGGFTLPASKTKIYAYLEALVGETKSEKEKIKEINRDYRNPKHWNLDPTHPALTPLKTFLDPFFST